MVVMLRAGAALLITNARLAHCLPAPPFWARPAAAMLTELDEYRMEWQDLVVSGRRPHALARAAPPRKYTTHP